MPRLTSCASSRFQPTAPPWLAAALAAAAAAVAGAAGAGCGGDGAASLPDDSRRHIMVVDDGIDPALPAFAGRIAALRTVECDDEPAPPGGVGPGTGADFDGMKAELLAELADPDESCRLREGIAPKDAFGASFSKEQRAHWNAAVRSGRALRLFTLFGSGTGDAQVDSIGTALARELVARPFPHGTATASVAADRVPELRLVLVELALIGASAMRDPFECPTQADVDLAAALLADADVRAAYVGRPVSSLDRQLRELRSAHGVGAVNESFGPLSRLGLEELAYDSGCGRLSFAAYFDAFTAGERGHEEAHPEPGVLWVRAAGNEGAALNDGADSTRCRIGDPSQMLVGSYGADGAHSYFTNFGDCVDVFVPGEDVVAALPGDWLFPLDGTSFAAPLALRLALFQAPAPFAPATAREALLALREPSRNIPRTRFPSDLALDVRVATGTSPLTAAGAGGGTTAPAATARRARPPAAAAVRRALWPLRWTRRHHR